jgi:hypothetical protein
MLPTEKRICWGNSRTAQQRRLPRDIHHSCRQLHACQIPDILPDPADFCWYKNQIFGDTRIREYNMLCLNMCYGYHAARPYLATSAQMQLLHLFCELYTPLLLVLDDMAVYERGDPFPLPTTRAIALSLNSLVFNSLMSYRCQSAPQQPSTFRPRRSQDEQACLAKVMVALQHLHSQHVRRAVCPEASWLAPWHAAAADDPVRSQVSCECIPFICCSGRELAECRCVALLTIPTFLGVLAPMLGSVSYVNTCLTNSGT